ncbi:MAG: undecaprenyldiphospho-muramoylpentapeptide beta-N-acetylglucosaminyltransferase [Pseudomonadota bacterium]|nr:undecaprenyldiphospho-muramoylpentapeptide beta-N-acetylglucosaminyltransferase [Pseudomonadota bacterium]
MNKKGCSLSSNGDRVLIGAGGTGGHLFPALSLAAELKENGFQTALVTDTRAQQLIENSACQNVYTIAAGRIAGRSWLGVLWAVGQMAVGMIESWALVRRLRPVVVVGFGGYASVPLLLVARFAKIPMLVHESNAVAGRANRVLSRYATSTAVAFSQTQKLEFLSPGALVHTGTPVRKSIAALADVEYLPPIKSSNVHLLVLGGSQGSKAIGRIVPEAIRNLNQALRERLVVTQQVRDVDDKYVRQVYAEARVRACLSSFISDMPAALARSHLVIARAGASTVAELSIAGRPSLLIPLPNAIDDHQLLNGRELVDAGGAWVLEEQSLTVASLAQSLSDLLGNPGRLSVAAAKAKSLGMPEATSCLAGLVRKLAVASSPLGSLS